MYWEIGEIFKKAVDVNITMWHFRLITVAMENAQCFLCVLFSCMSLPTIKHILCCTTLQLRLFYNTSNDLYEGVLISP